MTVFDLMIVPSVITAIFCALILWLLARGIAAWRRASKATEAAARARLEREASYVAAYSAMEDALAAIITELDSRPATYSTFPAQLGESITAAYARGRTAERQLR